MGNLEWATIRNCLVARDSINTWKWYGAFGPNVVQYALNVIAPPTDNTTGMPTEFINTLVNASTFTLGDVAGGSVILTGGGADNDGVKLQLGAEAGTTGENVTFAAEYPCYFACKFALLDADQSDVLAGFFVTDTTALDGGTDGMYFRTVDESAVLQFVMEKNSVESVTNVATLTDTADVLCEMFYWGSNVEVYIDSVLQTTIANTNASFPNDELLRLTFEFLSGAAAANTCTIKELRFIQIQR